MNIAECRTRHLLKQRMSPGDFCEVIQQFKSFSWYTWGIEVNRWGQAMRESVGIEDRHGTLWFSTAITTFDAFSGTPLDSGLERARPRGRVNAGPVPCNEIPFDQVVSAHFDEKVGRYRGGKLLRGWHPLIKGLCKDGFLRPDEALSALIGGNSWELIPRHFWA